MSEKRRHIVILDDDGDLRREIGQLLELEGHDVVALSDARLLDPSAFDGVDVLILDLMMPGIDGLDVLRRLGKWRAPPKLVLMTGHGEAVLRGTTAAAERHGLTVVGGLAKPFDPDQLSALLAASAENVRIAAGPLDPPSAQIRIALDEALRERSLKVAFQPIVRTDTFQFAGAEALLLGELPGIGRVSPPAIVAAASSEPDLISVLSIEVARQATEACAEWLAAGYQGHVSINLPLSVLLERPTIEEITAITRAARLSPQQVTFELTEDALYDSSAGALSALVKLRLAGFGLALDDVGQRSSGLTQLSNLPVTELKIDMEIVRSARTWSKARDIFAALAGLGRRLGLAVVAEGIETPQDVALARENCVDFLQGFLISRKRPLIDMMGVLPRLSSETRQRFEMPGNSQVGVE
jgi:EAL domain-containing protein (putative c-di-GMP-specific phosphodiesterase class I)/ActR/RegA family two-component response regulator